MLGDFLYKLLDRDAPLIEPFLITRQLSAASASLLNVVPARDDKYMLITHVAASIAPGFGQVVRSFGMTAADPRFVPSAQIIREDFQRPAPPAAVVIGVTYPGMHVYVWPGAQLTISAFFDAGGSVNTVDVAVYGFLIPRGNLTLAAL